MSQSDDVLARLYATLLERKSADPESSYVSRLYHDGIDAILKKIGEEAVETVIAAKGDDRGALVHELADLWFHALVLMAARGIPPQDVTGELSRRMGQSGIAEKAARDKR